MQEEHGIPLEALGKAMWRATQERGENPLFPLERGEMSEPEFLGDPRATRWPPRSAARSRCTTSPSATSPSCDPNDGDDRLPARRCKAERGLRLAMLTNNVREWEPRWRAMIPAIDELFEVIVDCAFVGMRKPDPAIYELTLDRLGLPAEACVFVDDIEVNCDAARARHARGALRGHRAGDPRPRSRAERLARVAASLGSINWRSIACRSWSRGQAQCDSTGLLAGPRRRRENRQLSDPSRSQR